MGLGGVHFSNFICLTRHIEYSLGYFQSCMLKVHASVHVHDSHTVLTAIFPGEPGLACRPFNSPSSLIPKLRILLRQA